MRKALGVTILSATLGLSLAGPTWALPTENGSSDSQTGSVAASAALTPAAAAARQPLLRTGSRSPAVVYVQRTLGVAPASGYYGTLTRSAVKALQKANGVTASGTVDKATWKVLLSAGAAATTAPTDATTAEPASATAAATPAAAATAATPAAATPAATAAAAKQPLLRKGSRSPAVVYVQSSLGVTPASGYFGAATRSAVKALQKAHGVKASGIVDKATWKVLLPAAAATDTTATGATTGTSAATPTPEQAAAAQPTLKAGAGPGDQAVVFVQQFLAVTPASGYFGALTKAAVVAYQKGLAIPATGIVDKQTWAAIAAGQRPATPAPAPAATPAAAPAASTPSPAPAATTTPAATSATIATPVYALPATPAARDLAVVYALAQVGKQYVLGGNGPTVFDCSGLVQQAYLSAGVKLPRLASQQRFAGTQVTLDQLLPGDLLYYQQGSSPRSGHISMYAGGGLVVEAANPRRGVRIRTLNEAWYATRFVAAVRIG